MPTACHCLNLPVGNSPHQVLSNKMTKSVTVAVTRTMRREGKYKDLPYAYTRKFMVMPRIGIMAALLEVRVAPVLDA